MERSFDHLLCCQPSFEKDSYLHQTESHPMLDQDMRADFDSGPYLEGPHAPKSLGKAW